MSSSRPIVIFDSGLGGLTVVAAVHRTLPNEQLIFLADRARVPYASLSASLIERYALECFDYLAQFNPKLIVVACNTVSAVCLETIRERYDAPVIDVIRPTAEAAARATQNGRIGVIATTPTVKRQAYDAALGELLPDVKIFSQGCPLFVPLVEEAWVEGEIPEKIVAHYLESIRDKEIDTAVLGCTHYEYFRPLLQAELGGHVTLINTPDVTARLCAQTLQQSESTTDEDTAGKVTVYSTDITDALYRVAGTLFNLDELEILAATTASREHTN